ncbi:hypothetical protein HBH92_125800 [Parastagonospora nodorum]|nr:hypothetical protein HBH93_229310 [Parastagonospora nodorum]KAH4410909.1 hypothetical protein HBH92_125800 [Parastagonospora nodorum]KAH4442955.1 hypothetical protein HBH91_167880 [Parastagonospora nodorum]KAH4487294.1 hypothetical protein HBH89_203090 [Parastagonospora nodorum]KAH4541860.1 hypothetical protein HBH85_120570 [Parastagonospora nodorum]
MEVYDATAALRYNVTDVVLREEVLPLNMASFDGVKGDITRSSKVECQEEQQVAEERIYLDVHWIVGCLTTVATIAMVIAMR